MLVEETVHHLVAVQVQHQELTVEAVVVVSLSPVRLEMLE
jgi:hypothetical protein